MRLVFCTEFFYPSIGGAQEVVRQLATRMVKAGHEVTVVTSLLRERKSDKYLGITVKSFSISGNAVNGMIGEIEAYRQFLIESNFDVLFIYAAQQWTFDALWEVLPELRMQKVIVPCGYSGLMDPVYQEYFKKLPQVLAYFDAIVYHAKNYRDYEFGKKHGLENRALIIPNGADDQEFLIIPSLSFRSRMAIPQDALMLLTVGSMNGAKGHLEVAQAVQQLVLENQSIVLVLNGNGIPDRLKSISMFGRIRNIVRFIRSNSLIRIAKAATKRMLLAMGMRVTYFTKLERCIKKVNSMQNRRILVCDLDRHDLVQAYFSSDLFVFASYIEYSPLVLYEANAAGVAFLSVSAGNAAEIADWTGGGEILNVTPDEYGLRKVSPEILAERIKQLLMDDLRRKKLGASGRKAWQAQFNWNALSREYMQLFERICVKKE